MQPAPGRMAQNGCGVTPVKYLRPVYMSVLFMGACDALSAVYFTWQRRAQACLFFLTAAP